MISSGASLLGRGKQNESVFKILLFPFISQHAAHTQAVTIKNSVILLLAWLPFCCWGFNKSHEGHTNMSQLLLFFYIQSQFRRVVLVSGTNFTKGCLKRSKGRNTWCLLPLRGKVAGPVPPQVFPCIVCMCVGGFSADTPASSSSKTNTWTLWVGKYQKEGGGGGGIYGGIYSSLNLTQQTPVLKLLSFFVFLPHNSNLCYYYVGGDGFWSPVLL